MFYQISGLYGSDGVGQFESGELNQRYRVFYGARQAGILTNLYLNDDGMCKTGEKLKMA